jgi:hypothetical protein
MENRIIIEARNFNSSFFEKFFAVFATEFHLIRLQKKAKGIFRRNKTKFGSFDDKNRIKYAFPPSINHPKLIAVVCFVGR